MSVDHSRIERLIGYQFHDKSLLQQALTHRSKGGHNNERLEFLGDSILSFVISAKLFEERPHEREGDLTRLRARLVKGETLSQLAHRLDLGEHLHLGPGELKSGGFRRNSILADAVEALLGAVFLDGGIDVCRAVILSLYAEQFAQLPTGAELKDAKTQLQEYLQSRRAELPQYEVLQVTGEPHAQTFLIQCTLSQPALQVEAEGSSRKKAEQLAAAQLLSKLREHNR